MSQYYESSKYISNMFFVMPYTYILDDSIKSPTLILTAITRLSYFSHFFFFYKIKNFFFLLWVNLYMITDTYLHDPPPFNGPFFMTPPFSAVSKSCDPPSVSTPPPPLLISDKSLRVKSFRVSYLLFHYSPTCRPVCAVWYARR